jgi:hypothetical protein
MATTSEILEAFSKNAAEIVKLELQRDSLIEAVLMFHDSTSWTLAHRARWTELTGEAEATTRALCNFARKLKEVKA